MRKVTDAVRLVSHAATAFEPRCRWLAIGRSLLAFATLTEILFTPDSALFADATGLTSGMRCDTVRSLSLWCLDSGLTGHVLISRIVAVGTLAIVGAGYRPRWTCVPHWYVTYSLAASMTVANGGDSAAVVLTLLLVPLCLGDDRVWQWRAPARPLGARWRGSAFAAQLVIRFQLCIIYVTAAVTKLADPAWRGGSAFYFVANDPYVGIPTAASQLILPTLDTPWLIRSITWSVIAVQLFIALTIIGRRRLRSIAVFLVAALHVSIIVVMSLPSFGLIMIAFSMIAYGGEFADIAAEKREDHRRGLAS
ncbi:sporulation-delaying protein SdpB family protein [Kutzneria buriramensis]|uniref:Antimicrobial peptide system SdpB family protein n=1 Tax=Kutzneria buriramensis TaxID=1045776 RepID=A0A3E0GZK7_9PSEU|nr:sporulation-delaying protein SdpB family protein [Kutzneria buriramensis]REH35775.1 antimicrobial peptide system SdpB family protein [Kutzneria buriramensis]